MRKTDWIESAITDEACADNISYYECDVSDWERVKEVAEIVVEEVRHLIPPRGSL